MKTRMFYSLEIALTVEFPDNDMQETKLIEPEWLFKHVSAVIHHGGAGTTACGLLNGRPTGIVPFFGE